MVKIYDTYLMNLSNDGHLHAAVHIQALTSPQNFGSLLNH